jgi:hypothetical protein
MEKFLIVWATVSFSVMVSMGARVILHLAMTSQHVPAIVKSEEHSELPNGQGQLSILLCLRSWYEAIRSLTHTQLRRPGVDV